MKEKIITNYKEGRYEYPLCNGENREGWIIKTQEFRETPKEFYERLAERGYKKISLYEVSTRVRGYHQLIAYVKYR